MRLDRPNRTFLGLVLVSSLVAAYVICGAVAGVLAPIVLTHISRDGWGALASVSLLPALLLLAIVAVGLAQGARVLAGQIVASQRFRRRTRGLAVAPPERLTRLATAVDLIGRVDLIGEPGRFSFVHGALRPRVVISKDLLERLSDEQLQAVLEHERYHVANLDPLKTVTIRVLSAVFFSVPALEAFHDRYTAGRELAADRRAIAACGTRALAGALLQAVRGPDWTDVPVTVPLATQALMRTRVSQLETGAEPRLAPLKIARAMLASLSAIVLLTIGLLGAVRSGGLDAFHHASLLRIAVTTSLAGIVCAAPFLAAGLSLYTLLAIRQRTRR